MTMRLDEAVGEVLKAWPGCEVGAAAEDLVSGRSWAVNGDLVFHPASTIKVPLLLALYEMASAGELSLDDAVVIHNGFPSSIDGSLYDLKVEDDSETTLYDRMGQTETLRQLGRLMIVRSSNLGTNLLMEKVPPAKVAACLAGLGIEGLYLRNRMMDMKAFAAKQTNRATANGLCAMMKKIGNAQVAGAEEILEVLLAQEFNEGLPAGLPPEARVAHKTGSIEGHSHDTGVVTWEGGKYAVAILTRGTTDDVSGRRLVAEVARAVHTVVAAR